LALALVDEGLLELCEAAFDGRKLSPCNRSNSGSGGSSDG
jgi:hypothetical protein